MYETGTNYIILDACRYDYFHEVYMEAGITGHLKKVNTGVSTTAQWYNKYWSEKTEFCLISQNPMPWHRNTNQAAYNFRMHKMAFGETWMDINIEKTLKTLAAIYGVDRDWVIHLLPPHLPFISPDAYTLTKSLRNKGKNIYWETQKWGQENGFDLLTDYYKKSIVCALEIIRDNLHIFTDKPLIITSDHGELIGEDNYYDHITNPSDRLKPFLYEVPWFEVDVEDTLLEGRMEMLGYMTRR